MPCLRVVLLWFMVVLSTVVHAETPQVSPTNPTDFKTRLQAIEKVLKADDANLDAIRSALAEISLLKADINGCLSKGKEDSARAESALSALGPEQPTDLPNVKAQRKELLTEKAKQESRLAECRLFLVRSVDQFLRLTSKQERLLQDELFSRATDALTLMQENAQNPTVWWTTAVEFVKEHSGLDLYSASQTAFAIGLVVLGIGFGVRSRKLLLRRAETVALNDSGPIDRLRQGAFLVGAEYAPFALPLLAVTAHACVMNAATSPTPFVVLVSLAISAYVILLAVLRTFLNPPAPAVSILLLPDTFAVSMTRWLRALSVLLLIALLVPPLLDTYHPPEVVYATGRLVFVATLVVVLCALTWWVGKLPMVLTRGRGFRFAIYTLLGAVVIAEARGNWKLTDYLLRGLAGTTGIVLAYSLLKVLLHDLFDALDDGRFAWSRTLREWLYVEPNDRIAGMLWLRLIVGVLLILSCALGLLAVWGVSDSAFNKVITVFTEGFTVFDINVIPLRVMFGLILFALLLTFGSWLKGNAERTWIPTARLERGAQEALATIVGYLGVLVAVLTGLSFAGLDFTKLAFIAGALSVGIGFGLQNVVSNFVSGIIMLFERPVRTGDWVVVGKVEGYVRKIRVRSTVIETFDMADVIVPNSDFISSSVINWTLSDPRGRVSVPVSVAYGNNADEVRRVLLEVAASHPAIISNSSVSNPNVSLRGFGDNSVSFELRCMVKDISKRSGVVSDLNFAIDKAFKLNGIAFPAAPKDAAAGKAKTLVEGE